MSRTYLVIGDSSGIGATLSELLINQGDRVIGFSRSDKEAKSHEGAEHHVCDCLGPDENFPALDTSLNGLVYLPGTINLKPFANLTDGDYRHDWEVNFLGAAHAIRQYLPLLKKEAQASIVLVSTVAVDLGMPFHASTAAAKGAVQALAKSLAAELAPQIRVNCIAPSLTETPLAESLLSNEKKKESSAKRHPLQRVGQPEDIAEIIRFVLSEQSGWLTGQTLHVDGGLSTLRLI